MIVNKLCRNLSNIYKFVPKTTNLYRRKPQSFLLQESLKLQKRNLFLSAARWHGEFERLPPKSDDEIVNIHIIDREGIQTDIKAKVGDNVLWLAHMHGIDIEGACECSLACSTCHVYVSPAHADTLPEATEEEEDLLDTAPFLEEYSRLGCQILLTRSLEDLTLRVPLGSRNMKVDNRTGGHGDT